MVAVPNTKLAGDDALVAELTGLIYDAAADPDLWSDVLARLVDTFELRAINFTICHPETNGRVAMLPASWGIDEADARAYEEHHAQFDPHRLPALRFPTGTVDLADLLLTDEDFRRTPYFNDFYTRIGLRHGFASLIHNEGGVTSVLACHRGPDHRPAGADELALLRRLTPHLQRARRLSSQLGTLQSQRRVMAGVLDRLPVGLVFVDALGRVVDANARGEEMLEEEDGICTRGGRIAASVVRDSGRLNAILANADPKGSGSDAGAPLSVRLTRPSGRRDLDVMACPIDVEARAWGERGLASTLLVLNDGEAELAGSAQRLQQVYRLSDAESKLAIALAHGVTVKEWAARRDVSVETVRWQLKQAFSKTGTSRQPDLIRLVLLGPVLAPGGDDAPPLAHD